jgi:hypothetical protein
MPYDFLPASGSIRAGGSRLLSVETAKEPELRVGRTFGSLRFGTDAAGRRRVIGTRLLGFAVAHDLVRVAFSFRCGWHNEHEETSDERRGSSLLLVPGL